MHISGIDGSRHVPHDHNSFGILKSPLKSLKYNREMYFVVSHAWESIKLMSDDNFVETVKHL